MAMHEHAELRRILPQRFPILLLDRILTLQPGRALTAIKAVTGSEPCYRGIPENAPRNRFGYPASLLLESCGQAAALLWLTSRAQRVDPESDGRDATAPAIDDAVLLFTAARNCVFLGQAYPGDVLRHEVHLDHVLGNNAFAAAETWIEDRRIAIMGSLVAVFRSRYVLGPAFAAADAGPRSAEGDGR
jgi:3-hydroxyacyl-[acyl-carrier-protein] dehydratase